MPQLGVSGARRAFRFRDLLPSSWDAASRLRTVRSLAREMPFPSGIPTALLGGPGFLLLPHDPCRAIGMLPHVRRVLRALDGDAAIACGPEVFQWLPSLPVDDVLVCQTSPDELDGWCRETADRRRSWVWSLDESPSVDTLVALEWLGGSRRISSDLSAYAHVANIRLPVALAGDAESVERARVGFASRLGLELPDYELPGYAPGKSVVLELPSGARRGEIRRWSDLAAALSASFPLIIVHFEFLLPEMGEALRALGNRTSLIRLSRSDDVLRLGHEVRAWVSLVGPAGILASQGGCTPVFLDRDAQPALDVGPAPSHGGRAGKFLGRRNPAPSEVVQAVLDLPSHGM